MSQDSIAQLFSRIDRALWIVTSQSDACRGGLVATFVSQASIVPEMPRVLVGLAHPHHTQSLIAHSQTFALHLLKESQIDWVWRFGLEHGGVVDKLSGFDLEETPLGNPRLTEALGWLDCRVETTLETGDRAVHLAQVLDGRLNADQPPLTMHRLLESAPQERLKRLKQQHRQDAQRDAYAIKLWRKNQAEQD